MDDRELAERLERIELSLKRIEQMTLDLMKMISDEEFAPEYLKKILEKTEEEDGKEE